MNKLYENKYHTYREWKDTLIKRATTPMRAIKMTCLDCTVGSYQEIYRCDLKNDCPLWRFRRGNPNIRRKSNPCKISPLQQGGIEKTIVR